MTTVFDILHRLATTDHPAGAVEDGAQRLPLSHLGAAVDRRAAALLGKGLRPGDRALIAQGKTLKEARVALGYHSLQRKV